MTRRYAMSLKEGQRVDLGQEMSSLALDLLQASVFGYGPDDVPAPARRSQRILVTLLPSLSQLHAPRGPASHLRLQHRIARELGVLSAVIDSRLKEHLAGNRQNDGLLPLILDAADRRTSSTVSLPTVSDTVLALLLTGHQTMSTALTWAWYELSRSTTACELLQAELRSEHTRHALHHGRWQDLPVCRAVTAETLRLHHPALLLGRRARRTFALGPETIHRGTLCFVSPYGLHRDPRSWTDPASWQVERWLDDRGRFDPAAPGHPRGAYLPFGSGTRLRAAEILVTAQTALALAVLARTFDVRVARPHAFQERQSRRPDPRGRFPAVLHRR